MLRSIHRFVSDPDDVQDVYQDACLDILRKGHTYRGEGPVGAWASAIARNRSLMLIRRRQLVERLRRTEPICTDWYSAQSHRQWPEITLERQTLRRDLDEAIQSLPPRERLTLVLRLVEGRSTKEAAALMGCATGTISANLHRAVRKLRRSLAEWAPMGC